jgi:hypothetical protein
MTENATTPEEASTAARLRALLRRFDPTLLGLLGLLSLPSYVVDSLAFLEVFSVFFLFFLWLFVGPLVVTQDLLQFFGGIVSVVRHRGSLPDAASYDQAVPYRLPVEGTRTVVTKHAESEYSFLAHLRPESVAVEPGQRVERGQQVGRCGHSGNSSEPHLHFQVQDTPDFATAASLPVRFDDVETDSPGVTHEPDLVPGYDVWHSGSPGGSPDGYHGRTFVVEGQRVAHAEQAGGEKNLAPEVRSVDADADATDNPADDRTNLGGVSAGWVTSTLKRAAYALAVAGVLAYAGGWVTSALTVAGILAGASVAAPAYRYAVVFLRGSPSGTRTGWLGTPLGFALGAAVAALQAWSAASLGVGLAAVGGALLLAGFLGYVVVGVYEGAQPRDLSSESVAS